MTIELFLHSLLVKATSIGVQCILIYEGNVMLHAYLFILTHPVDNMVTKCEMQFHIFHS